MNQAIIEFTEQEANSLLEIIDIAIRANGLSVAHTGSSLSTKIHEAFNKRVDIKENGT